MPTTTISIPLPPHTYHYPTLPPPPPHSHTQSITSHHYHCSSWPYTSKTGQTNPSPHPQPITVTTNHISSITAILPHLTTQHNINKPMFSTAASLLSLQTEQIQHKTSLSPTEQALCPLKRHHSTYRSRHESPCRRIQQLHATSPNLQQISFSHHHPPSQTTIHLLCLLFPFYLVYISTLAVKFNPRHHSFSIFIINVGESKPNPCTHITTTNKPTHVYTTTNKHTHTCKSYTFLHSTTQIFFKKSNHRATKPTPSLTLLPVHPPQTHSSPLEKQHVIFPGYCLADFRIHHLSSSIPVICVNQQGQTFDKSEYHCVLICGCVEGG